MWSEILGQESAVRLLHRHAAAGQVHSAYLLSGPDGVGKRRLAREMAQALNCAAGTGEACGTCPACRQISRGAHPDVHLVTPAGAGDQIQIEPMRQLLGRMALRPFNGRFQVAILDGAERLNEAAANCLLKSLEEPPARARFLLLTSRPSQCLPTIVSRCQLIRCGPLPDATILQLVLQQGCEPQIAEVVAPHAGGSVSAALALAQQWPARQAIRSRLAAPADAWLEQPLPEARQDVALLLDEMVAWLRDVAVAAAGIPDAAAANAEALRRQAACADPARCAEAAVELVGLRESLDQFVSPKMVAALARETWLALLEAP